VTRTNWLAVGAVAGALAATSFATPAALLLGIAAAVLMGSILLLGTRRRGLAIGGVAAAVILGRAAIGALAPQPPPTPGPIDSAAGWDHSAVVLSVNAPSNGQQRATLELRPPDRRDRVWASLPRYPQIAPGDVVRFGGELEPAPQEEGFGEFLKRSGITFTTRARQLERLGLDGSPMAELEQLRRGAASAISEALPEPEAGLASAMSIGLRDLVSRDVATDFRISGLSHVVAISGWHIAMLGVVVSGLLSGIGRRPRSLVVLAAICAYAVFAGASPSVLRAAVMASVVLLARESGRRGSAAIGLSLTVAGMLVIDPATITDVGFQLSVAATAGLLVWGTRAREWLAPRLPKRTPGWLLESLAVSSAAQLATLPLVLFHFGTLSVVSPLANLLIAPLVAPSMLLTALALACGVLIGLGLPALLFAPVALAGGLVIGATIAIAHFCAALPFASVVIAEPVNLIAAGLATAAIGLTLRRRRGPPGTQAADDSPKAEPAEPAAPPAGRPRTLIAILASVGLAVVLTAANGARPDGRLHVVVLDIGQGDAILLRGPNGGRALVDGGPDPDRLISLLDQRIPAWDRRLDLVVLTHPHEDHVAGLAAVLARYEVGDVFEPGMVGTGPGYAAFRQQMAMLGRHSRTLAVGDSIVFDGIRIDVVWPLPGSVPTLAPNSGREVNDFSIVLDLHYGSRRILLTGDAEDDVDPQLLQRGLTDRGRVDLLKVAHHGSATASSQAFLDAIKPKVAVISVGADNDYGHPAPSTLQRLRGVGATVYRTDLDGTVDVSTNGEDLVVATSGQAISRTYNRVDGSSDPRRGSPDPGVVSAARLAARPQRCGCRRRRFPCSRHRAARARHQRHADRDGSAAARCRQGGGP